MVGQFYTELGDLICSRRGTEASGTLLLTLHKHSCALVSKASVDNETMLWSSGHFILQEPLETVLILCPQRPAGNQEAHVSSVKALQG